MPKHKHHHHVQLIEPRWIRDHHIFLIGIICIIALLIAATIVRTWKQEALRSRVELPVFIEEITTNVSTNTTSTEKKKASKKEKKQEIPTELPRALDGVIVPTAESNQTPICVMIENLAYEGVRPQYGISFASVVYEVIVEGGITRFMVVYPGPGRIDMIGPLRSARDTYLEFVSEYHCAYFHAGGSYTALLALNTMKLRHVDALIEPKYFWRDRSRYAPHNLFTSMDNLRNATQNHHWYDEGAPTFTTWLFSDALSETQQASLPRASSIAINFGYGYDVAYTYEPSSHAYLRKNADVAHMDAMTQTQLAPKTVIIQHVNEGQYIEGKGRINWPVTGEGKVEIFRDGVVYTGTWKKDVRTDRTQFMDSAGNPISLSRGQVWIEIVPPHISTSFQE